MGSVLGSGVFFVAPCAAQTDTAGLEFFERHIRPVLVRECYECHSAEEDSAMGGLQLDTRQGLLSGGDHGAAIVPGDVKASLLIDALHHGEFEMPPEGKLAEETIRNFERWVAIGAPDPRSETANAADNRAAGDGSWWAFQPPQLSAVPEVEHDNWPRSDVDRFVLRRLEQEGLEPVADADRRTLIRRAYFDLWGLPPTPEEVDAFVSDDRPGAFAELVDRLLDSPRYGERWGRHWLDVARFAESTGHERNFLYPHAWRYRDYVIEAFNDDVPYDEFVVEQLAGDLLPAESQEERDRQFTATGFLAIGPRNLLGRGDQYELDTADDQINVTMRAILGLTVSCARCHDHKFDPISTEEYYGLAGIFLSTESLYGTQPGTGGGNNRHPSELIPIGPEADRRHAAVREHAEKIAEATKEHGKIQNRLKKLRSLPEAQRSKRQDELKTAAAEEKKARARLEKLREQAPPPPAYAMGVRDAEQIVDTEVRIGGAPRDKGKTVARGVLACCTVGEPPQIGKNTSGRLELARWLTDPEHPLTSRVIVNRIWHHLLGRGLVPTVDNFGHNGRPPSHPELLDWLAVRFQQDGWSVKRMIRRIMLSRVYQLSGRHHADNHQLDPDNKWLWRHRPRRLEAEAIRDAMLAISGTLELCPPDDGSVVARLGDGCLVRQIDADKLKVDAPYRSIYLPTARFFEPESLQIFDGASANLVVGQRAVTNVPAQALYLLNNEFVIKQARQTGSRLLALSEADDAERIGRAYRLALGRPPTSEEREQALQYVVRGMRLVEQREQLDAASVWGGLAQALFASAEFRYLY